MRVARRHSASALCDHQPSGDGPDCGYNGLHPGVGIVSRIDIRLPVGYCGFPEFRCRNEQLRRTRLELYSAAHGRGAKRKWGYIVHKPKRYRHNYDGRGWNLREWRLPAKYERSGYGCRGKMRYRKHSRPIDHYFRVSAELGEWDRNITRPRLSGFDYGFG
jgi:hypothetical protein